MEPQPNSSKTPEETTGHHLHQLTPTHYGDKSLSLIVDNERIKFFPGQGNVAEEIAKQVIRS